MSNYEKYQNQASSEKITLAILNGASRLFVWVEHDTDVYKKALSIQVISSIKINDKILNPVESLDDLELDTYFYDGTDLYINCTENLNDRKHFVVLIQKYFFSNKGLTLPHDLNTGYDVYFEPLLQRTSQFGTQLDVVAEGLSAIEGSGSLALLNDFKYWNNRFDKIAFDNQLCSIYSYSSKLEPQDAKLLFTGYIESKSYSDQSITFKIKDLLYNLRNTINLKSVAELGFRNKKTFDEAKQRLIYGRVKGFRPTNIDAILDGSYPIQGTISAFFDSKFVVGTDTKFKEELISGDKILIKGVQYTIAEVTSDQSLTLTSNYSEISDGNLKAEVIPSNAKSYINRTWLVSGHSLSQPTRYIMAGSSTSRLVLSSTVDLFDNDDIWIGDVGTGYLATINSVVNENIITLKQSIETVPPIDTPVFRPCVQNLRMNDLKLIYREDYEVDENAGILNIYKGAEQLRSNTIESNEYITAENGTNFFTGVETSFSSYLKPGDLVRPKSTDEWYSIKSVSDVSIELAETYTGPDYTTSEPQPEITAISGLSNLKESYLLQVSTTVNLQGKFFRIFNDSGSVAVWFDVGNVGTAEPVHNCDDSIEITSINPGDSKFTIVSKIKQKLNLSEMFTCTIDSNENLIINQVTTGVRPAAKTPTAEGFTALSLTKTKQKIKCVADVGDSLDNTGFYLWDSLGLVYFWYGIDGNSNGNPTPTGNFRSQMIGTVNTDDSATTVRNKTKTVLNAWSGFTATDYSTDGLIIDGAIFNVSIGTMPAGYSLTTVKDGASVFDLNSKHFVLPYYDGATSKTHGFWFDVDGEGVLPSITADASTVVLLDSDFDESEVFKAIADTASALDLWAEIVYTDNTVKFEDQFNQTLSTTFDAATSGFIIVQAQAGITTNPLAGKLLQYKNYVFNDSNDVLSCDVYGKTDADGNLLRTAPSIVKDLITQSGLSEFIDDDSFDNAEDFFREEIAIVFPDSYSKKTSGITYRNAINVVNGSVFGILLQSNDFRLQYESIRPQAKSSMLFLNEADTLDLKLEVSTDNLVQQTSVNYGSQEYNYSTKTEAFEKTVTTSSDAVKYISKKSTAREFNSSLLSEIDAQRLSNRWSFLLENSTNTITLETKLQTVQLQTGDVFQLSHPKLPQRLGSLASIRLLMVQSISKSASGVTIEAIDLSNALNRVAKITNATTSWDDSSDDTKLISGFYTDNNGLISSDENSFYTNLIW